MTRRHEPAYEREPERDLLKVGGGPGDVETQRAADRVRQESAQQDGRAEHRSEAADETADPGFIDLQSIDQRELQPSDQRIRQTHDGQACCEEDLEVSGMGKVHVQQCCRARQERRPDLF